MKEMSMFIGPDTWYNGSLERLIILVQQGWMLWKKDILLELGISPVIVNTLSSR